MSAQGIFGSRSNRRRFWRCPVLARLDAAMRLRVRPQRRRSKNPGKEATKEYMSNTRSELAVVLGPGATQGRNEPFQVPWRENQSVLDVVTFVQRHLDPT